MPGTEKLSPEAPPDKALCIPPFCLVYICRNTHLPPSSPLPLHVFMTANYITPMKFADRAKAGPRGSYSSPVVHRVAVF